MKKTLQLFQLLLAVFGLYAAIKYPGSYKYIVSLGSLVLVWILEKIEFSVDPENASDQTPAKQSAPGTEQGQYPKQQLEQLLHSKNVILLTDIILGLLRDLGLSITLCPEYKFIDRMLRLEGTSGLIGLKIVADVAEPDAEWDQWDQISDFTGAGGRARLLIIANNAAGGTREAAKFKNFSTHTNRLMADKNVVGLTTSTLHNIYK